MLPPRRRPTRPRTPLPRSRPPGRGQNSRRQRRPATGSAVLVPTRQPPRTEENSCRERPPRRLPHVPVTVFSLRAADPLAARTGDLITQRDSCVAAGELCGVLSTHLMNRGGLGDEEEH